MKNRKNIKRFISYLLTLCMVLSSLYFVDAHKVEAIEGTDSTTVYFYNAHGWETIGAYVYGNPGEALGGWGTTEAKANKELGDGWYSVVVPAAPQFNIIFYNTAEDAERAELLIEDAKKVYVSVDAKAHDNPKDAKTPVTTVYFLDNLDWKVYAYVYTDTEGEQPLGGWPGTEADISNAGENWYEISVPANAPFHIIFNDGVGGDGRQFDFYIEDNSKLYASAGSSGNRVYETKAEAESAVGIVNETIVYFLNNKEWKDVRAYAYGQGEPLGGWPGVTPESAENEIGKGWMKVALPVNPPFSIIFSNQTEGGDPDKERTELQIPNKDKIYVTGSNETYSSKEEAELATGMADSSLMSTAYFYNYREWQKVYGYAFTREPGTETDETAQGTTLGAEWPGKAADSAAEEVGEGWWKITIPKTISEDNKALVKFNDGVHRTEKSAMLTRQHGNYVIPTGDVYSTKEEAEEAAKNAVYDDGNESGPNKDIDGYSVEYSKAGANLPYIMYEAESAATNAEVLKKDTTYSAAIQSEASGRQAVVLNETGDYVEFTLTEPSNSLVLRYSMPDSTDGTGMDANLDLYVDGEKSVLPLTSKYAWVYGTYPYTNTVSQGMPHRFFDEKRVFFDKEYPAGTKIKLQKDTDNTAENYIIDFIECELVGAPLEQPEGSLSVTDFGAVADDGEDDYNAFIDCIEKAKETKQEVWIPKGTFDLKEKKALEVKGVTLRGAGMWYSNLLGEGAAFKFAGTCKFYDFAMTGMATVRLDSEDLAGFESEKGGDNTTIQNIWMEHMKVGVWSAGTKNLAIQGCRIRNTFADGINLCSLTNNAVVRNNNVRNTGDDCIAIWPWLGDCISNTITHNTVQMPMLANGVAVYGGGNNKIEGNYVLDIINNGSGICIGSEFDTVDGYHDITTVSGNTLERCGSYQTDENYPIGALWVWSTKYPINAVYDIRENMLLNPSYEGFLLDCKSDISGVTLKDNKVSGATDVVVAKGVKGGIGTGSATIDNLVVENCSGKWVDNQIPDNFTIKGVDSIHVAAPEPDDTSKPDDTTKPDTPTYNPPVNGSSNTGSGSGNISGNTTKPNDTDNDTTKPDDIDNTNNDTTKPDNTDNDTTKLDDTTKPDDIPKLDEDKMPSKVTVQGSNYKVVSQNGTYTIKYIGVSSNNKKTVTIPASVKINGKTYKVTAIKKNTFKNNKKIEKIVVGKNIEKIGENAFKNCKNLKKIIIKSTNLKSKNVGKNVFKGISKNAVIKVPKGKVRAYKEIIMKKGGNKNITVKAS